MITRVYAVMLEDGSIRQGYSSKRWFEDVSRSMEKVYVSPIGPKGLVTQLKKHGNNAKVVYADVDWKDL